jgi:hypothetical protein
MAVRRHPVGETSTGQPAGISPVQRLVQQVDLLHSVRSVVVVGPRGLTAQALHPDRLDAVQGWCRLA